MPRSSYSNVDTSASPVSGHALSEASTSRSSRGCRTAGFRSGLWPLRVISDL